jgi:hypothetical protein
VHDGCCQLLARPGFATNEDMHAAARGVVQIYPEPPCLQGLPHHPVAVWLPERVKLAVSRRRWQDPRSTDHDEHHLLRDVDDVALLQRGDLTALLAIDEGGAAAEQPHLDSVSSGDEKQVKARDLLVIEELLAWLHNELPARPMPPERREPAGPLVATSCVELLGGPEERELTRAVRLRGRCGQDQPVEHLVVACGGARVARVGDCRAGHGIGRDHGGGLAGASRGG